MSHLKQKSRREDEFYVYKMNDRHINPDNPCTQDKLAKDQYCTQCGRRRALSVKWGLLPWWKMESLQRFPNRHLECPSSCLTKASASLHNGVRRRNSRVLHQMFLSHQRRNGKSGCRQSSLSDCCFYGRWSWWTSGRAKKSLWKFSPWEAENVWIPFLAVRKPTTSSFA